MTAHPATVFHEKNVEGGDRFSMTRLVAFMFAVAYLLALELYAFKAKEINWPFAVLGCVTLLAVPLQALCTFLGQWISSKEGRDLLTTLTHKAEESLLHPAATPAPSVSMSATVGPAQGEK